MCVHLYIHNAYTKHTHIYVNKSFILDVINRD